ncbi:MAG: peptide deformylase, partial [Flavobacteriaceae bacterium]
MILPIVAYGAPVLKKEAVEISNEYPNLDQLIENMWETMYASNGVGLAAPQIGLSIRLFVIDAAPFSEDEELKEAEATLLKTFKKAFINPTIIEEEGPLWEFNEGCLSIPDVREDV